MHLQSLELFGFKSFPDKTIFNFHEGVTAIVGPNGCGKSNVLDAVRWVLGEQSAKSLRGDEMADVIFNGTDSRKPLGFAEVSLTFTDCASELGVDWHDVRVTRRLHRDGISEYFLNKTGCRLKDIHNLFADTGVGRTAYSIMEQGKIDLILSSRPEDRRSVFEEAAGITKYKTQKKEALRKLEATEANLLRIGDIIKEVKRQIGSLQRQAGKARRYQMLHTDLQVLDTHFSYRKLQTLGGELTGCTTEIERVSEAERETRSEIDAGETELADLRIELDAADDRIASARTRLQQLESEIATHRNRIEFNEQRGTELRQLVERSDREIGSTEAKLREHEGEIESANALVEELERVLAQKREQLDELAKVAAAHRERRHTTEQRLHEMRVNLSKDELRLNATANDLRELAERYEATKRDAAALALRIEAAGAGRQQLHAKVEDARAATRADKQTVERLFARVRNQEEELGRHQGALVEIEKQFAAIDRTIGEKESRHEVLRQLNEEGEGLAEGSRALLKSDEFEFAGALAAQLDVAREFVPAIEATLGRNLHAIIPRDAARASAIINYLNGRQLGQAALVLGKTEEIGNGSTKGLPQGAIAWAVDKVKAPDALRLIVHRLLHDVAIFESLDTALNYIAKKRDMAAATLHGEFISRDGVLFGGSGKGRTDSLLERKARIDSTGVELAELRDERSKIEHRRDTIESQLGSANAALEEARRLHQHAALAQTATVSKITELEREQDSAERDLEILKSEYATLERQIAAANTRMQELEEQRAQLELQSAAQDTDIAQLSAQHAEALTQEEDANARLAELRIAVATQEQKHQSLLAQRAPMLSRQNELREVIATRRADIEGYQTRLLTQAAETESARAAIESQTEEQTRSEADIEQLTAVRAKQLATINTHEGELRRTRNRLSELQEKRSTHSIRQTQLQLQIEHLTEHVMQRYQVDLRQFVPDSFAHEKVLRAQLKRAEVASPSPNDDDLQKLIAELARQLDNMGPVNLDAVQEYDELEERHRFLETQNTDLTNSRRELLDVIARINATTQKLFADTFAQVCTNFREMFAELFGGGRADLQLLDENDALNCGIEIIAKPPGKQLQSISLLSGGERTMAAVALLFAIYMVRPSPFCVLDEMDAPLDESNINRFIRVLERFVEQSQFIIITHNKRTIAKSDVLYGVTMEERGVSKLVGMKMTAPRPAEANNPILTVGEQRHFSMAVERQPSLAAGR
jgi:chromosome segregation protein